MKPRSADFMRQKLIFWCSTLRQARSSGGTRNRSILRGNAGIIGIFRLKSEFPTMECPDHGRHIVSMAEPNRNRKT